MKRQRSSQWMQTGLLGIVAGTSVVLTPALTSAQGIEEVQTADEPTLSAEKQSVSQAEPTLETPSTKEALTQEPDIEAVTDSSVADEPQSVSDSQSVSEPQLGQTDTEMTSAQKTTSPESLTEDTPLVVEQPAEATTEATIEAVSSPTQPAIPATQTQESLIKDTPSISDVPKAESPASVSTETPTTAQAPATTTASGISILTPGSGSVVDKPATTVIIEFGTEQKVELRVNGKAIDSAQVGRTETNSATQKIRQTWYGVILDAGVNTITVNEVGQEAPSASIQVEVPGEPSQIKVRTAQSKVPADGRSTAQVMGYLLDANGNQSNWDAIVTLETTSGKFVGTDNKPDVPGFQVEAIDGKFTADLQSSINAGLVRVRASAASLEGFHQFQFSTPIRPSALLTGVVDVRIGRRGTNFYDSFREFLPVDGDNGYEVDARAQAFGITSIGDWLLTGAFNSARPLNEDCNGESTLFKASGTECDYNNYATYGDNSTTDVTAPSTDNLFVRLERTSPVPGAGSDYFMWGITTPKSFLGPLSYLPPPAALYMALRATTISAICS